MKESMEQTEMLSDEEIKERFGINDQELEFIRLQGWTLKKGVRLDVDDVNPDFEMIYFNKPEEILNMNVYFWTNGEIATEEVEDIFEISEAEIEYRHHVRSYTEDWE